jgi:hypothetical protein
MGFNNDRDRPSTIKLVPSAALSTCNYGVRSTTDLAGIMIMCTSGATCLSADGCLTTAKNPTKHVGLLFESLFFCEAHLAFLVFLLGTFCY